MFDARQAIEDELDSLAEHLGLSEDDVREALVADPEMVRRMAEHLAGKVRALALEMAARLANTHTLNRLRRQQVDAVPPRGAVVTGSPPGKMIG